MVKRQPKKTESLEIRLSHETKRAFMARCRAEGVAASVVLRHFIAQYLEHGRAPVRSMKELAMTVTRSRTRLVATSLAGIGSACAAVALFAVPARAAVDPRVAAVFAWIDTNHDGAIDRREFVDTLSDPRPLAGDAIGIEMTSKVLPPSQGESRAALFARLDVNHDGRLTPRELGAGCTVRTTISPAIAAADADHDGRITEAELAAYLTARRAAAGEREPALGVGLMAHGIFAAADRNHTGAITVADLRR